MELSLALNWKLFDHKNKDHFICHDSCIFFNNQWPNWGLHSEHKVYCFVRMDQYLRVKFSLTSCRWYLVLCFPCLFIQQQHIILLTGFSGPYVFILKLFLYSLSCGSCRTLRSRRIVFLPSTIFLICFNNLKWRLTDYDVIFLLHLPFYKYKYLILPFNLQIVEPFTAHYVFALGIARFLSCAHWVLQVCH